MSEHLSSRRNTVLPHSKWNLVWGKCSSQQIPHTWERADKICRILQTVVILPGLGRCVELSRALTSVRKRKKIWSLERTGCDATRSKKFSRPTLRRSTKSGSRLSADSLCHTNSACNRRNNDYAATEADGCKRIPIVSTNKHFCKWNVWVFSLPCVRSLPFSPVVEGRWCTGRWPGGMFWAVQTHCSVSTRCLAWQGCPPPGHSQLACKQEW